MWKRIVNSMFREDLDIQRRLLNLILSAAFIGGTFSFIATIAMGGFASAAVTAVLLLVVVSVPQTNNSSCGSYYRNG